MDMNQPPSIFAPGFASGATISTFHGPTSLVIKRNETDTLVTISMKDGSVTFGPNYTPDEAARKFWEALSGEYRRFLAWKAEHPEAH